MLSVELHPQRQFILDCLADPAKQWSNNAIAELLDPPISAVTISKYRRRVLLTAGVRVLPKVHKKNDVQEMNTVQQMDSFGVDGAKQDLLKRVQKHSLRRERWIADAESKILRDADGLPMLGPDGKVLTELDHRALASHDRNHQSALELEGRLTGALLEQSSQTNVQIAILAPGTVPAAAEPVDAGPAAVVYDIGKTRS